MVLYLSRTGESKGIIRRRGVGRNFDQGGQT